jgi:hypothetical protein
MSVLIERGILVEAPKDGEMQRTESSEVNYYTFLLSSEKPFIRSGLEEGTVSFTTFKVSTVLFSHMNIFLLSTYS